MRAGPPPVPGGRSPEEREAARREREARRAARSGKAPPKRPKPRKLSEPPATTATAPPPPPRNWLAEVERLTSGASDSLAGNRRGGVRRGAPRRSRMVAAGLIGLVLVGVGWFLVSLYQPLKGEGEGRVRVVVPQGASLGQIADLLERKQVVASSSFFQLRARLSGRSSTLKPGRYELARDMSFTTVLDRLEHGLPPNVVQVTIPEGRSRREVTPVVKRLNGNYSRATRRHPALDPRDYGAPPGRSLEGFLFPATYELKKGQPVRTLVGEQLTAFKRNFNKVNMGFARRRNLTPYEVLIIASLVEREAAVAKERPIIASVIYNRLKRHIRLDIDATTRFAVGNWGSPLKQSELQSRSPYNTRVHTGLPPGPIGSPGLASIKAAVHPARTSFLFYVVKPGTCGQHNFAATDLEHQRNVAKYDVARAQRGGKSPTSC